MKKTTLVGLLALLSTSAFGAELTLQKEFVPRVLNDGFVYPESISDRNSIDLAAGGNQLAVTIGQIVFEDGKRRKFDSQPLLLEFDASEQDTLLLTYKTFRTIEDAKSFENNPVINLTNESGKEVDFQLVQLGKGGMQGFRDYEREVADYNKAMNKQYASSSITQSPVATKSIKTSFTELSAEQQQEFMQWAMRNLK